MCASFPLHPSPNSVLFAMTIFKRLLPEAEDHYQSELWHCAAHSCLKWFDAEGGRVAGRIAPDSCLRCWWLWQSLAPQGTSQGYGSVCQGTREPNALTRAQSFSLLLSSSGAELLSTRREAAVSHQQSPQPSFPSLEVLFLVNSYKSRPPRSVLWEEA